MSAVLKLLVVACLVLAGAFAPSALAQSIPDLPDDVEENLPDDVEDRLPDGNGEDDDGSGDGNRPELPELPETNPDGVLPGLPSPDGVSPQAVLEPPPRPNPFMPSPGSPMGSNDPECVPTEARPNPVVLVHGTFEDRNFSWSFVSPMLKKMGYCVYAINYGNNGTIKIEESAKQLREFIDVEVLASPGTVQARQNGVKRAERVSIVAHSQGGLMSRVYLKREGGLGKVEDLVSLAASNHGTDNVLAPPADEQGNCESCGQQFPYERSEGGNDFTEAVNEDDETPGDVSYTQINTRFDDVVFPYFSAFLADSGSRNGPRTKELNGTDTTNFCLQDEFPQDTTDHVGTQYDPFTFMVIAEALAEDGPADEPDGADSVCAPLAERGASGGDEERDGDPGRDRGGDGNGGGNGNGSRGSDAGPAPFAPVFSAEAFAYAQCLSLDLAQNFRGMANLGRLGRCMAATVEALAGGTTPGQACRRQRLSSVRGVKRRSDFSACSVAAARALVARRLAGF